jgi:ATP phosphoribosyltransferase regulatory subunit
MMGLRADSTPQVARIDAHLLNRQGVARLCYCGPVLHTRPGGPQASREPLQFGAELYGHAGLEADLEILTLALDSLRSANVGRLTVDLADARIVSALLKASGLSVAAQRQVHAALAGKDATELRAITRECQPEIATAIQSLVELYGDVTVLDQAATLLPAVPEVQQALGELKWLASHIAIAFDDVQVSFDLADLRGYAYYTGVRFSIYAPDAHDALARGGRYDEVGSVFGRKRPAVGFSLDVKELATAAGPRPLRAAIRAPWGEDAALRAAIAALRQQGETVVCVLPGHESEVDEFQCDRELRSHAGHWSVIAI